MTRNLTPEERDEIFGPLSFARGPGDSLTIDPPPPLDTVDVNGIPVRVHTRASESLSAVARDLEELGLLRQVNEAVGFQPRIVRLGGGRTSPKPSAHAYGAAVDVNFSANPVGSAPTAEQRAIAEVFDSHGWFWGESFEPNDPHHFVFQGEDPTLPPSDATPRDDGGKRSTGVLVVVGGMLAAWWLLNR